MIKTNIYASTVRSFTTPQQHQPANMNIHTMWELEVFLQTFECPVCTAAYKVSLQYKMHVGLFLFFLIPLFNHAVINNQ